LTTEGLQSEAHISRSPEDQSHCVDLQQWVCYHSIAVVQARNPSFVTPRVVFLCPWLMSNAL
jgi:hypothetical protein